METNFQSAIQVFQHWAKQTPDRRIFTYVNEKGDETSTLTCGQAFQKAKKIAVYLRDHHSLKKGDRVLLVYPPGLEFVEAFLGCILSGIIPVPISPPIPLSPQSGLPGYTATTQDCGAVAQLTCQSYYRSRVWGKFLQTLSRGPKWPNMPWIVTDTLPDTEANGEFNWVKAKAEDLAFLQYTSGSTRAPKGVAITFGNIWHQTQLNHIELRMSDTSTSVSWMPHYHDFTLISGIMNASCGNNHLVLFAPATFLRRPAIWGELIHRYRATHTAAPDFGFKLFTRQTTPEQRASWDFSSVKVMMSAAEPIRADSMNRFLEAFSVTGLDPAALCPTYGLAEHTGSVTVHGKRRFKVNRNALEERGVFEPASTDYVEFFGCGTPSEGVEVRIVDPKTFQVLPNGQIGEIWVNSGSKAQSYFGRPEDTRVKLQASLEGSDLQWLRTGDLGVIWETEIVVISRLDDMMILRGRNIFPQDAEGIIGEGDPRVRPGRVMAFAAPSSQEPDEQELTVALELKEENPSPQEMKEVAQVSRTLLQQELGIAKATLVFAPKGSLPKTTSGKLRRQKCRTDWLEGKLLHLQVDRGFF